MNAPKISYYNWEKTNEERLTFAFEKSFSFSKSVLKKIFLTTNVLAFVFYKLILIAGLTARTAFLSAPIIKVESEESWLFRQIR